MQRNTFEGNTAMTIFPGLELFSMCLTRPWSLHLISIPAFACYFALFTIWSLIISSSPCLDLYAAVTYYYYHISRQGSECIFAVPRVTSLS